MANNLDSNFIRKLMKAFLAGFESARVLSKTINTQLFQGAFEPSAGTVVDVKRPHQYRARRTATGDVSSGTNNDIQSGKATATVQDYITIKTGWTNIDEALKLNQLEEILKPAAQDMVTELETSLSDYMIKHSALSIGTPGTAVDAWADVAGANSLMKSIGVPDGENFYVANPYTIQNLSSAQTGLSADPSRLVQTAWENAQISSNFAGLKVITSNAISDWTIGTNADQAGALSGTPTATYASVKDTMQQTWAVTGFSNAGTVKAGDILEVTGRYHVNNRTRKAVVGADGNPVKFRAVVTADVTLGSSGEGNLVVENAAIFEASGQYNNVSTALTSGDVVTIIGTSATTFQPAHFYNRNAFVLASVKLPKLFSTDTVAKTEDGFSIRVSKYSTGDANTQSIRFDMLPAFGVMNPLFAGKGFGS